MRPDLVLFDLDETLVATEALRDARHGREPSDLFVADPGLAPHPGVVDCLAALDSIVRIGLVTSSARWYVDQLLTVIGSVVPLAVIVTYDDVSNLKPHPESLHLALARSGAEAARTIYVGDADVDFDACAAAGVRFVGAGWANRPTYPPQAESARTPRELVELVTRSPR